MGRAPNRGGRTAWQVLCGCGTEKVVRGNDMTTGRTTSCGCYKAEVNAKWGATGVPATRHGAGRHPSYFRWVNMMRRCYDAGHERYHRYGGRGIQVFGPWHDVKVFVDFLDAVLGPCPDGWSLDRTDPDGDYEPGNVRWADALTQRHNRSEVS